jgi:hypothetical protein
MNETFLLERQVNTCSSPYQFYECSLGGHFSGCCSMDPCTDGICPAENQPGGSSQTTATTSTSTSMSTSTSTSTSTSSTSLSSKEQTVTMTVSATFQTTATTTASLDQDQIITTTTPTVLSSSLSTPLLSTSVGNVHVATTTTAAVFSTATSTTTPSDASASSSNKTVLIGASVGGVVGALALFMILFLWCRKRKSSKTSNSKNDEKRSGYHGNSDYNTSSSWSPPSVDYYSELCPYVTEPTQIAEQTY